MNKKEYDRVPLSIPLHSLCSKQALIRMENGASGAVSTWTCSLEDVTCSLCTCIEMC